MYSNYDTAKIHTAWVLLLTTSLLGCPSIDAPAGVTDTDDDVDPSTSTGALPPAPDSSSFGSTDPSSTGANTTSTVTGALPDSETTNSTDPIGSNCGDGVIDLDEECDDGVENNGPGQNCNLDCTRGECGDGILQEGLEESCDAGEINNQGGYGGCTPECELGPRCGDGELQEAFEWCECYVPGAETCEFMTQDGTIVDCDANTCRYNGKIVFLAVPQDDSGGWPGKIEHANKEGLEAADWLCDNLADSAGLADLPIEGEVESPRFRAWLSTKESSVAERFTPSETGYVLRSGVLVAASWDELITSGPLTLINHTQFEGDIRDDLDVWSNTDTSGVYISETESCGDWTVDSISAKGRIGTLSEPDIPGSWTDAPEYNPSACFTKRLLYCFEQ